MVRGVKELQIQMRRAIHFSKERGRVKFSAMVAESFDRRGQFAESVFVRAVVRTENSLR